MITWAICWMLVSVIKLGSQTSDVGFLLFMSMMCDVFCFGIIGYGLILRNNSSPLSKQEQSEQSQIRG